MKQEQINSLIRHVLTLIGAFLIGGGTHHFFGQVIDTAYWEEITGVIITAISIYWSIKTKEVDIEKLQGAVRQVITFILTILTAKGILSESIALAILAFVAAVIVPWIQAGLARKKVEKLSTGEIHISKLKGSK